MLPGHLPDEDGEKTCPDLGGGTNFFSPSYDPAQRLFFVTARETCARFVRRAPTTTGVGDRTLGGTASFRSLFNTRVMGALLRQSP